MKKVFRLTVILLLLAVATSVSAQIPNQVVTVLDKCTKLMNDPAGVQMTMKLKTKIFFSMQKDLL
ncbi:MAG: hypothetical protein K6C10_03060 [Prevotella sp.]|nr:hypothetical protein [Prevotella sp.]